LNKIYGIDLGTTNSLIGTSDGVLIGGMVKSIAKIGEGKAGNNYVTDYDAVRSFKVDISCGDEGKESVLASSLVLKELMRIVKNKTGDTVSDVVISVPAFFSDNQRQATLLAAKIAGLDVRALINEPTAAAMKYNQAARKLSVVYDLGGGTFDVSVIDSRLGLFDVQATDGVIVGGDDLDNAIRSHLIKKCKFKMHNMKREDIAELKSICEEAKIRIQKTRSDVTIDLSTMAQLCDSKYYTLTVADYVDIMKLTFKKTIVETKKVIAQAIHVEDIFDFILVGGSTRCPYLADWITEEIGVIPKLVTYNPDTIVAEGACLYAKLIEDGTSEEKLSDITKPLSIGLHDGTVRVLVTKGSKLPIANSLIVTNPEDTDEMSIKLYQGDSILAENNEYIGKLIYKFDKVEKAYATQLVVKVSINNDGVISLLANEMMKDPVQIILER